MIKNIEILAEVKTHSPFGYRSNRSWDELFAIATSIGNYISIHTDSRWGGSFELIKKARRLTNKPILAKGIHANDELVKEAIHNGADYVLVVGRIPRIYQNKCLIEPNSLNELSKIPENYKVIWNSRNLSDGNLKKETFKKARSIKRGWLCQASNITSLHDIENDADAILVGTNLEEFISSLKK